MPYGIFRHAILSQTVPLAKLEMCKNKWRGDAVYALPYKSSISISISDAQCAIHTYLHNEFARCDDIMEMNNVDYL